MSNSGSGNISMPSMRQSIDKTIIFLIWRYTPTKFLRLPQTEKTLISSISSLINHAVASLAKPRLMVLWLVL